MSEIEYAIEILRRGGLVAFPTETVYGLGADATNVAAVKRIFELKGRPPTNPLICHVADAQVAQRYARVWPPAAARLSERFWPGPLTLVVPKTDAIPTQVTAGFGSVGLRAPNHSLTLKLLRAFGRPLAGPSANRSSQVSPTTAQHVRDDLGTSVDLVLDGGPCTLGIESTVLDLTAAPVIRRPGGVSREEIEALVGRVEVYRGFVAGDVAAVSPGQHQKHYAPRKPAFRFAPADRGRIPARQGIVEIGARPTPKREGAVVAMPDQPALYAQHFYAILRELDSTDLPAIYLQMPPDEPRWAAVRDRLIRATRPLPE